MVTIRGTVATAKRAKFPNGRRYHTLIVRSGDATLTVFSWEPPAVKPGDPVQVEGTFHTWRYNIHHMVESRRVSLVRTISKSGQEGSPVP